MKNYFFHFHKKLKKLNLRNKGLAHYVDVHEKLALGSQTRDSECPSFSTCCFCFKNEDERRIAYTCILQ